MRDFNHRITDSDVGRVVRRDFPPNKWSAVLTLLRQPVAEYAGWSFGRHHQQLLSPSGERPLWVRLPRVQAALVKESRGVFERLLELLERDAGEVVNAAENPNYSAHPRPHNVSVSEATKWIVEVSPLRKVDCDQYRKWLDRPTEVRSEDGV